MRAVITIDLPDGTDRHDAENELVVELHKFYDRHQVSIEFEESA